MKKWAEHVVLGVWLVKGTYPKDMACDQLMITKNYDQGEAKKPLLFGDNIILIIWHSLSRSKNTDYNQYQREKSMDYC